MVRHYSAAARVGYRTGIIAARARGGLRGCGAQPSVAVKSPAFIAVDLGPLR